MNNATYDETERRATEALDQALVVRGGLLLPPGTLEVDNTTSYFSASSDHVTIDGFALLPILVVGDITSQRVREDILLPTFTTRLGLPQRFQMDFTVPYGYVLNRTVDALGKQTSASQFGLGDIQAGVSRQLTFEHGRMPDLLANLRFKTATGANSYSLASSETSLGSGFYGVQGNLTVAKSSDPVVFFGNLSYTENLAARHTVPANDPNNPGATMVGHFRPGSSVRLPARLDSRAEHGDLDDGGLGPALYARHQAGWDDAAGIVPGGRHAAAGNVVSVCAGKDDRSELRRGADAGYAEPAVLGGAAVPGLAVEADGWKGEMTGGVQG